MYDGELCDKDIMLLQDSLLTKLCIEDAGVKLTNEGIVRLTSTLRSLDTLELSHCAHLSYHIVMLIPAKCSSLRDFTFRARALMKGVGGNYSNSHYLLADALPKIFPHVKEFSIDC